MKITVKTRSLAFGGACIGEIVLGEDPSLVGKKAFVRFAAPDELVEARVTKSEKKFVEAELLSIVEGSPERITPPCPKFGPCGGCDLQHLNLVAQRRAKLQMVESMLKLQGQLASQEPIEPIGLDLPGEGYRHRVYLHINLKGEIGFYKQGTGDVVDTDRCLLANEQVNQALLLLRPLIKDVAAKAAGVTIESINHETFLVFKLREIPNESLQREYITSIFQPILSAFPNVTVLKRAERVIEQLSYKPIRLGSRSPTAGHFSQVNEAANQVLVSEVLKLITGQKITDFYAGSGNFSLSFGRLGREVQAVEVDPILVKSGTDTATSERLPVTFFPMTCEQYLGRRKPCASVVLDPPRTGARAVAEKLNPAETSEVVYVSCNLPTLIRDLKILTGAGYNLVKVKVLDMFPQTHHLELVTLLRR